jgi:hypothetical protein
MKDNDAAERLLLADKYDIPSWTFSALWSLVHRDKPMDILDFTMLGIDRILKIAALREQRIDIKKNNYVRHESCACQVQSWVGFLDSDYRCQSCNMSWQRAEPSNRSMEKEIKTSFAM